MNSGEIFEERYRIVRLLGTGGFADVYLGEHIQISQYVAIKVLKRPGAYARFLREGRILAQLAAPQTVRILDFGQTVDGFPYLISEYVDGETLAEIVARGPLAPSEALDIIRQVLESLREAHQQGIVHRDIKPANVMRLGDGQVKVLDFGIAKPASASHDVTAAGVFLGTPRYLAPETLLGSGQATPAADIFAVGLLAHLLLTGREAVTSTNPDEIVAMHVTRSPYTLPDDLPIGTQLRDWLMAATAVDPAQRLPDAGRALEALPADARATTPSQFITPEAPAIGARQADVSGTREIELELGHGETPALARPSLKPAREVLLPPAKREATVKSTNNSSSGGSKSFYLVVFLAMLAGAGVVGGVLFLHEPPRPQLSPIPDDPKEVVDLYTAGRAAFDDHRWIEALEKFHALEAYPDTHSARGMSQQDYIGRTIANVLEESIDVRENARSKDELEKAKEGPWKILELYPHHEMAKEVLDSLNDARPKRKKGSQPKIKITGVRRTTPR